MNRMKRNFWHTEDGEDSLEVLAAEVEELENDELSGREAGFLSGYEEEEEYEEI